MPAGDGVSLPTTLSQLGSVAKTQAKGQQTSAQVTPFSEQVNRDDDLRVQRVKPTEESQQEKIDANQESPDKRQRRRLNRERKRLDGATDEDFDPANAEAGREDEEHLGILIDMRV